MHQSDLERFEAVPCLAVRIGKVVCFTPIFGGGTDAKLQLQFFQKVDVLLLCFVLLLVAGSWWLVGTLVLVQVASSCYWRQVKGGEQNKVRI